MIDGWGISSEIALRWVSLNLTDRKSTLVQVMAWCRQAPSHYLNQCWQRSTPYGEKRPQWVNSLVPGRYGSNLKSVISEHKLQSKLINTSWESALRWMPQNTFDGKSTSVRAMPSCWQHFRIRFLLNMEIVFRDSNFLKALSHYLSPCSHIIKEIFCRSFQGHVYLNIQDTNPQILFILYMYSNSQPHLQGRTKYM